MEKAKEKKKEFQKQKAKIRYLKEIETELELEENQFGGELNETSTEPNDSKTNEKIEETLENEKTINLYIS